MACAACGFHGPPPHDVSSALRAAGAMLRGLDVRRRQLSDAQRAAVLRADARRGRYLVVWLVVSVLYGGCAGCGGTMIELGDRGTKMIGSLFTVPFVLMLVTGGLCLVWLSRSGNAIRLACAAIPPAAPGEPAACRVCGAPVVVPGGAAFARCGYCAADNLVEPRALDLVRGRQAMAFDAYEAHVRGRAIDAELVATASTTLVIVASFLIPPVAFALGRRCGPVASAPDSPRRGRGLRHRRRRHRRVVRRRDGEGVGRRRLVDPPRGARRGPHDGPLARGRRARARE
jgi:hypothetical protein